MLALICIMLALSLGLDWLASRQDEDLVRVHLAYTKNEYQQVVSQKKPTAPLKASKAQAPQPSVPTVDTEIFAKAKLVVGRVSKVEEVPNSDKLLRYLAMSLPLSEAQFLRQDLAKMLPTC